MTAPINTLVAFATSPGFVAYDGEGGNSPYTTALIEVGTAAADENISEVFEQVRRAVYTATAGAQVPWESSTLMEPFRFSPPRSVPTPGEETVLAGTGGAPAIPTPGEGAAEDPAGTGGASDVEPAGTTPGEETVAGGEESSVGDGGAILPAVEAECAPPHDDGCPVQVMRSTASWAFSCSGCPSRSATRSSRVSASSRRPVTRSSTPRW